MNNETAQNDQCGCRGTCILLSFLAGGIVGAAVALLAVSRHGEGIKERIGRLGDEARQKVEDYVEKVKAGATSAVERGKEILEQERSVINKAVDAGKEILEKQKSVISDVTDMGKERGR